MEEESAPSNKQISKFVIIAIIIVVASVMGIILLGGGRDDSNIKTMADLKSAVADKKALNCTINIDDDTMVIQANEGFSRIKLITDATGISDGKLNVLMVKDDATYIWDDTKTLAIQTIDNSMIDEFVDAITSVDPEEGDEEESDAYSFKCQAATKANLSIPTDIDFMPDTPTDEEDDYDWDTEL